MTLSDDTLEHFDSTEMGEVTRKRTHIVNAQDSQNADLIIANQAVRSV